MTSSFNLKLMSLNVKGLNGHFKRSKMFTWLNRKNNSIIFLQETYSTECVSDKWKKQWNGHMVFSHGTNHSRGVAILFKNGLDINIVNHDIDLNGRFIILDIVINGVKLILVNAYAPNSNSPHEQTRFFSTLRNKIQDLNPGVDHPIILGGDLNILMNIALDRDGGNPVKNVNVMNEVANIMDDLDLVDIWRCRNPLVRQYTWRQCNPLIQSRLDYWLVSNSMQDIIKDVSINPAINTDHSAVHLNICSDINTSMRGPSYWKFNDSLCDDVDYCNLLEQNVGVWLNEYCNIDDSRVKWELLKYEIRRFTQSYCKKIAKQRREHIFDLENILKEAELALNLDPSETAKSNWEDAKRNLDECYDHITQGVITRSRADWVEYGEKNSKYFLNLEKANKVRSTIYNVCDDNGNVMTDGQSVQSEIYNYYSKLYSAKGVNLEGDDVNIFFNDPNVPVLSEEDKTRCDGPFTVNECFKVLNTFKNNKAPGNDGLTASFYKRFWHLISKQLIDCFNTAMEKGELSNSQKQGVITLIQKSGKDKRYIKNYRPITLLNVDVKIASKVIATRLQEVLPSLIGSEQSAFVKDRYIGDPIRTAHDLLFFTKHQNIPGILLTIDFEKAYDSVDHEYLFKVLKTFNFSEHFINCIKVFYTNISSCVMNNGLSTKYFNVNRGLRQGDPNSCYLFVLAIELLLIHIRNNDNIKGINITPEVSVKMACYADDITCFVSNVKSAEDIINLLSIFQRCSSMKVNLDKTEAMWMGSNIGRVDNPLDLCWKDQVKILGIVFTHNNDSMWSLNYDDKFTKLNCIINLWKQRKLTPLGKVTIMKSFGLSQFLYTSSMISMPESVQKRVNTMVFNYIWNGPDKIKRSVSTSDYESGGIKMFNIKARVQSQNVMWVKRFLQPYNAGWKEVLKFYLSKRGGDFIFCSNVDVSKLNINLPPFYHQVLVLWNNISSSNPSNPEEIQNQCIWNNRFILIGNKPVYYANWANLGLNKICDLLDNNAQFIEFHNTGLPNGQFLKWYGVIGSIPILWRQNLGYKKLIDIDGNDVVWYTGDNVVNILDTTSKDLYNHFNVNKYEPLSTYHLKHVYSLNDDQCKRVYTLPFKVTLDAELRWMQFRIVHNIFPTNAWLYRVGLRNDGLCPFCKGWCDLEHVFVNCIKTVSLLSEVIKEFPFIPVLSKMDILYGVVNTDDALINHMILIFKQCIFRCCGLEQEPSLTMFKKILHDTYDVELNIARRRDKLTYHFKKWDRVMRIVNAV